MPQDNLQGTVTSSAQTLSAILSASTAIVNRGGFQILNLSASTASVFWGLAVGVTGSTGSEIAAGAAQLISPTQAADSAHLWLIAASNQTICVSFPGG